MTKSATIPSELWASYRRGMMRYLGSRGARWAAHNRKEILSGKTHIHLLEEKGGALVGFALFPKVYPVGFQLETFYLLPRHRTTTALRTCLRRLIGKGQLFSVSGLLIGVSRSTQRQVFTKLGFRFVERQNLWIDPHNVRRGGRSLQFTLRPLRRSDKVKLLHTHFGAYRHHIDAAFGPGADPSIYGPDYVRQLFLPGAGIDFGASFVMEDRGNVVGDIIVMGEKNRRYIHDLSVTPGYQGKGLGSALVRASLSALEKRGLRRVNIGVTLLNPTGAYAKYLHLGFRRERGRMGEMVGLWVNEEVRRNQRLRVLGEV